MQRVVLEAVLYYSILQAEEWEEGVEKGLKEESIINKTVFFQTIQ